MEKAKIRGKVWLMLLIAWISMACTQIITFSYGMMASEIMTTFNLTVTQFGYIGSAASVVTIFVTIPVTLLASKFNVRWMIPVSITVVAIGNIIFGLAANVPMLYVGKIVSALFLNSITTVLAIYKLQNLDVSLIPDVNGIEYFIGPLGQVIATLAMASILAVITFGTVYVIVGVVMVLVAVLWVLAFNTDKQMCDNAKSATAEPKLAENPLKSALKVKTGWLLACGWPGTSIIWIGMFYYYPTLATTTFGFTSNQAGLVLSMIPIFSAIGSITAPKLARLIGRDKPLIWPCGFILPFAYLLMAQSTNLVLALIGAAVAGYCAYLFVPLGISTLYKLGNHPKVAAMGVSMILTGVAIGSFFGSAVIGSLIEWVGGDIQLALTIACCTPFLFGILTIFMPERGRKWMEEQQAKAAAAKAAAEAAPAAE